MAEKFAGDSELAVISGLMLLTSGAHGMRRRYTLLFLLVPYACVLVSSTLYYAWRQQRPRQARQINKLGYIVFGVQLMVMCGYSLLMLALGGGQQRRPFCGNTGQPIATFTIL